MDRAPIDLDLFKGLLETSFSQPLRFPSEVDQKISRNRSLSSQSRREMKSMLFRSLRWRRRLWGDIFPSTISLDALEKKLAEAETLHDHLPLARWNTLSLDTLGRELSYPTWLVESCVHKYGLTESVKMLLALNQEAPTTLRTNTLKTSREKLAESLKLEKVESETGQHSPWALHLYKRANLRSLKAYKNGWFEIQDEGSQLSIQASGARPKTLVIDACSGAGGKSLALAAMMSNEGRVIAVDSDSRPLEELKKRAKRAGAKIVEAQWVAQDDPEPLTQFEGKADLVVVDAPCSSLGTLRRRPWLKWHYTKASAEMFPSTQLKLLRRFSRLVKEGGSLHYVTCTIHPLENQEVVATFVRGDQRFREAESNRLLQPHVEGTDGFFVAKLTR